MKMAWVDGRKRSEMLALICWLPFRELEEKGTGSWDGRKKHIRRWQKEIKENWLVWKMMDFMNSCRDQSCAPFIVVQCNGWSMHALHPRVLQRIHALFILRGEIAGIGQFCLLAFRCHPRTCWLIFISRCSHLIVHWCLIRIGIDLEPTWLRFPPDWLSLCECIFSRREWDSSSWLIRSKFHDQLPGVE